MWCLIYIAIAGSAPPIDCSMTSQEVCLMRAGVINAAEWRENMSQISHLAMCISEDQRAKYLRVKMIEKAIANQ